MDQCSWYRFLRLTFIVLISLCLFFTGSPVQANWWNYKWKSKRLVTIDPGDINSAEDSVPLMINIGTTSGKNATDLSDVLNESLSSGEDIRLINQAETGVLDYEIERWDSTGSDSTILWVRSPDISATGGDTFYLYYNNLDNSANDAQDTSGVWGSGYKVVHHFNDTGSQTRTASDRYNNDANPSGGVKKGPTSVAGRSDKFNGSGQYDSISGDASHTISGKITIEMLIRGDAFGGNNVILKDDYGNAYDVELTTEKNMGNTNNVVMCRYNGNEHSTFNYGSLNTGKWYYVVCQNTASAIKAYINGGKVDEAGDVSLSGSGSLYFSDYDSGYDFDGSLDEVRISDTVRSENYIAIQDTAIRDNLLSYGTEQFVPDDTRPVIKSYSVNSSKSTYFYEDSPVDTGPMPPTTADTVYFNNRSGEGADQQDTVSITWSDTHTGIDTVTMSPLFGEPEQVIQGSPAEYTYTIPSSFQGSDTQHTITAFDLVGNTDAITVNWDRDISAGTYPSNLTATDSTAHSISFSWTAFGSDPDTKSGFDNYSLFYKKGSGVTSSDDEWNEVDDSALGTLSTDQTTLEGLEGGETYSVTVSYRDRVGNLSDTHPALTVTTDVPSIENWNLTASDSTRFDTDPDPLVDTQPLVPDIADTVYYNNGPSSLSIDINAIWKDDAGNDTFSGANNFGDDPAPYTSSDYSGTVSYSIESSITVSETDVKVEVENQSGDTTAQKLRYIRDVVHPEGTIDTITANSSYVKVTGSDTVFFGPNLTETSINPTVNSLSDSARLKDVVFLYSGAADTQPSDTPVNGSLSIRGDSPTADLELKPADRVGNRGIDDTAQVIQDTSTGSPPSGLSVSDSDFTSITLDWSAYLSDPDTQAGFRQYQLYYSKSSPVSTSDSQWTKADDSDLSNMGTGRTTISGLSEATDYQIAITYEDQVRNVGDLSSEITASTLTPDTFNALVINAAYPKIGGGDDGTYEYVEIFNQSFSDTFNLKDFVVQAWTDFDNYSVFPSSDVKIPPRGYVALMGDTYNSSDAFGEVRDSSGDSIDSFYIPQNANNNYWLDLSDGGDSVQLETSGGAVINILDWGSDANAPSSDHEYSRIWDGSTEKKWFDNQRIFDDLRGKPNALVDIVDTSDTKYRNETFSSTFTVRIPPPIDSKVNEFGDTAGHELSLSVDKGSVSPSSVSFSSGDDGRKTVDVAIDDVRDDTATITSTYRTNTTGTEPVFITNREPDGNLIKPDTGNLVRADVSGTYVAIDADNDPGTITVEVSDDSGTTWDTSATLSGSVNSVSTSENGDTHTFTWDSLTDMGTVRDTQVKLRLKITDGVDTSVWDTSGAFTVDNDPPDFDTSSLQVTDGFDVLGESKLEGSGLLQSDTYHLVTTLFNQADTVSLYYDRDGTAASSTDTKLVMQEVSADSWSASISYDDMAPGDTMNFILIAEDNAGNTTTADSAGQGFEYQVRDADTASLVLNEVSPYGDGSKGHDWVEIKVLDTGTVKDQSLDYDGGTVALDALKTILLSGDTILVHGTTGTSDTDSVDGGSGDNAGDTYWDVYDNSFGLSGSQDHMFVRNGSDLLVDALIWEQIDGTADQASAVDTAVSAGEWTRQGQSTEELDAVSSHANTRRTFYRDQTLSDSGSRFGWDEIPASMTLGAPNDDVNFNINTGSGTTSELPETVVASGYSGFSFDVTYQGDHEFGTNGRRGYVTERIPAGYPDPTLTSESDSGFTTITASDDALNDSGIFVHQSGDTIVWAELIAGVTGFDAGDTVEIRYGNPDKGGSGLSVSGTGSDTFWVQSDPTGNNYKRLPDADQPVLTRSSASSVTVSPGSDTVAAGDVLDFSGVVKDSLSRKLLGADLDYAIAQKPDGADSAVMVDTSPGDGITNKEGTVNYSYQTDTGSEGTYKIRVMLDSDRSVADTVTINVNFDPVALGTSRLISDSFVVASAIDGDGTYEDHILLYNPTGESVDLSGYWLARYTTSRNWNSPTGKTKIGNLTLNNASDYVIDAGGWYLIGRSNVTGRDAEWGENISNDYAVGVFPKEPGTYGSHDKAASDRVDAVGFKGQSNVYEDTYVSVLATTTNSPHRRPDVEPGAFFDRDINDSDVVSTSKSTTKNTNSDTVRPTFYLSGPTTVSTGDSFTLSGTQTVTLKQGIQADSVVDDYTGDSAWAEVFVDTGTITPDTSGIFTNGKQSGRSFSITDASGSVTISYVDGPAEGSLTITVSSNATPSVDLTKPDTGDLVAGANVSGTYVLVDSDNDPGTVSVEVSADSGSTWDTEATISGDVESVSSSASGDTHTINWDSLTDLGSVYDTEVKLRIRATDGSDTSDYDTSAAFSVDNIAPGTPSLLSPDNGASTNAQPVSFDWSDGSDTGSGVVNYKIQVDTGNSFDTGLVFEGFSSSSDTTLSLSEDSYVWRVYARDDAGNTSGYTTSSTFTVDRTVPPRVTDLSSTAAVQTPDTGASLYWKPQTSDVKYYSIYRSDRTSDTSKATQIDTSSVRYDTTTVLDSSVTHADSFYFYVTVVDTAGNESDSSNATTAAHITFVKTDNPDSSHRPGDTVIYQIEYVNDGFGPADNTEVVDAVPDSTTLADSASVDTGPSATIEYSTDGGATWQSSSYPRTDVTHIRWSVTTRQQPKAKGGTTGVFKAKVKID
ncbi:MAG: DUF2341 domain-containing protein [bacterium]